MITITKFKDKDGANIKQGTTIQTPDGKQYIIRYIKTAKDNTTLSGWVMIDLVNNESCHSFNKKIAATCTVIS